MTGETYDLAAIRAGGDGGIAAGKELIAFAETLLGDDDGALDTARAALMAAVGDAGLVDAAAVAATFNAIDRVADATGIGLDDRMLGLTEDLRADLALEDFRRGH